MTAAQHKHLELRVDHRSRFESCCVELVGSNLPQSPFIGRREKRSANTRKTKPVARTHTGIGRCENPGAEVGVPEVASSPNLFPLPAVPPSMASGPTSIGGG